jgi:hypothetical protein
VSNADFTDDLLEGGQEIADFLHWKYRKTVHALNTGRIPGHKSGPVWIGRKSRIRARLLGEDTPSKEGSANG